ncbi:TIGR03862 family flavoprotein [Nitrospirillum amazonense]|uniref:TIGR03862 family flavoprotein n=1 Tax=Nitrospirillum amazonense TaxID=28077 RepID=UPI002DD4362B|nr:TIGR03862 family flavoprotein [Nitrospirillum amazonense]MEC4593777.1 TIGR03862 family flavoprotein [Nitrospirillum amazonense]
MPQAAEKAGRGRPSVAIIGAGPAGLMAAEALAGKGIAVTVYDAMPSPARKFLMAGRGGLNITHSEPLDRFLIRYGAAAPVVAPWIRRFTPDDLRAWVHGLGIETFVGSSGRVFPVGLKASPLLRAWLRRLDGLGVTLKPRHRWTGWTDDGALAFDTPEGPLAVAADATLLALGGASWPRLGSDGGWAALLAARGVDLAPFRAANAGFDVAWSPAFIERAEGQPLKRIALSFAGQTSRGEAVVTRTGLEGGALYALGAPLREAIARDGQAVLHIDLKPDLDLAAVTARLAKAPPSESLKNRLRKALGLEGVIPALLREGATPADLAAPAALAQRLKALPISLTAIRPMDRAISTAGGITLTELDEHLMLRRLPGVFAVGEMLDWEAPTGGYLLQACFSGALVAAGGMAGWLNDWRVGAFPG